MADPARELTREQELKAAIEKAILPSRDYRIFMALLARAEWRTAVIKDRFQPRSLGELAAWSRMSVSNLKYGLTHLQRHLWVERHRVFSDKGIGGRGRPTRYVLCRGRDCECSKAAKDWPVSTEPKAANPGPVPAEKLAKNRTLNRPSLTDVSAGQRLIPAKSVCDEGGRGEGSPKPEYRGGPKSWDGSAPLGAALTLTIGDRTRDAITCRGCGELCWTHVSFNGCHASCTPPEENG